MIGHRKFTWQTEIPPAAEWFDYDREENIMEFEPETQPLHKQLNMGPADPVSCPYCGCDVVIVKRQAIDREGTWEREYACDECGLNFTGDDIDEW